MSALYKCVLRASRTSMNIRSFAYSFALSFVMSSICSLVRWFVRLFVRSFFRSFFHSFFSSFVPPFLRSFLCSVFSFSRACICTCVQIRSFSEHYLFKSHSYIRAFLSTLILKYISLFVQMFIKPRLFENAFCKIISSLHLHFIF